MTTLMPLLSVTGLLLLLLTAAPTSCYRLTPGSHLAPFSRGEVKDEDTSAPGVVIDNVVDVKAEDFVEKDTIADKLTESALRDDVLQTLETTGLNADNHDGLPPSQSVEQGTKVTSSRHARSPPQKNEDSAFERSFKEKLIINGKWRKFKRGTKLHAERDYKGLLAKGSSQFRYELDEDQYGHPIIKRINRKTKTMKVFLYMDEAQST